MSDAEIHATEATPEPLSSAETVALSVAVGGLAGAAAGAVWGGVGGRIAMRIIVLSSNDGVRGITSDDGFEVGTLSGATAFLLVFSVILGGIAGMFCGLVRALLGGPTRLVGPAVGGAVALGAAAFIVHTDGVDFRFLDPLWLTVGLFVLLPGAWGCSVVALMDWLLGSGRITHRPPSPTSGPLRTATGWLLLLTVAILGGIDLARDVRELVRIR